MAGVISLAVSVAAQEPVSIPDQEVSQGAPTEVLINSLVDRATTRGWGEARGALRAAALRAYQERYDSAAAWYYLYRWSVLLSTRQEAAISEWILQQEMAKVAHANMASTYKLSPASLGVRMSSDMQRMVLANAAFSEEFFTLLSPLDNPEQVLIILQDLYQQDPALFAVYQSLALAIAVVYDVPPPPDWPHGQVSAAALSRKLPPPGLAFTYWIRLDCSSGTLQHLRRLPASELKFIVDETASFAELDWARKNVALTLADLPKAYNLIKYRTDRLAQNKPDWTKPDYRLATILSEGGICVDQAYFASTVGKANGVPTLLFRGAGLDGRHAWFGYLDAAQHWQLDCGRYAEQKFVVGVAYDPQTWGDINDHELLFITERFRTLPAYKVSMMHTAFADEYLRMGQWSLAVAAAREAVNRERRNVDAWNILVKAQLALTPKAPLPKDPQELEEMQKPNAPRFVPDTGPTEAVLREAVLAFQQYPDLQIVFSRDLVELLRTRGETSLAHFDEQRLGKKYESSRVDLAIQQAAQLMNRSMKEDDLFNQIRNYNQLVDTSGKGAGVDFYDKVVVPFVLHLAAMEGRLPNALQALDRAKRILRVEPGKQLEADIASLAARLKSGKN